MVTVARRDVLAASLIALLAAGLVNLPAFAVLRGLSLDVLTGLRWAVVGALHNPAASPTVVVALDEETYRTPPFESTPYVAWTREIGRILTAVVDGGAATVGFDIIYSTSIEQSEVTFDAGTLGDRVRGFDRDFLRALAGAARAGKVVLGQVQHSEAPILPSPGQRIAVGQKRNIRALNVFSDPDGVIRRVTQTFSVDGAPVPSFGVELAARALQATPDIAADGTIVLAGYRPPAIEPNTITLNFEGGADDIPTYSVADLHRCLEKGDADFFRRHFAGKVVLIGTVLDVEDRKITSKRYATAVERPSAERCALAKPAEGLKFARDAIPGVYIHATAVNNLLRRAAVTEFGIPGRALAAVALAAAAAGAALLLGPAYATLAFAGLAALWTAGAIWAFVYALALPLIDPVLAGVIALAATNGYRFVATDRDKRLLRDSFALYLAPAVIERMLSSSTPPTLGGETRRITIFFSDIEGFSTFSEKMSPTELVALINEYLSAMTDIIEAHGGFVDKYIGDAIVAVFGAPIDDPDHALNAVRAALACQEKLRELNRGAAPFRGLQLAQRIGLNSGEALVGNMGSRRRFNYTVMGDAVNLASRIEGANKFFATNTMASEMTADLAGPGIVWRELDAIQVKGRASPVKILEPLAETGRETAKQQTHRVAYAEGLACWRSRAFTNAARAFARVAADDPPSALFLKRAQSYAADPPPPSWEPVNVLDGK